MRWPWWSHHQLHRFSVASVWFIYFSYKPPSSNIKSWRKKVKTLKLMGRTVSKQSQLKPPLLQKASAFSFSSSLWIRLILKHFHSSVEPGPFWEQGKSLRLLSVRTALNAWAAKRAALTPNIYTQHKHMKRQTHLSPPPPHSCVIW